MITTDGDDDGEDDEDDDRDEQKNGKLEEASTRQGNRIEQRSGNY